MCSSIALLRNWDSEDVLFFVFSGSSVEKLHTSLLLEIWSPKEIFDKPVQTGSARCTWQRFWSSRWWQRRDDNTTGLAPCQFWSLGSAFRQFLWREIFTHCPLVFFRVQPMKFKQLKKGGCNVVTMKRESRYVGCQKVTSFRKQPDPK